MLRKWCGDIGTWCHRAWNWYLDLWPSRTGVAILGTAAVVGPPLAIISIYFAIWPPRQNPVEPTPRPPAIVQPERERSPLAYPDPRPFVPSKDRATAKPKLDPKEVTVWIDNKTNKAVTLALFDCDAYFTNYRTTQQRSEWIEIGLTPKQSDKPYDRFFAGSGWFALWVFDEGDPVALGAKNLFDHRNSRIVIEAGTTGGPRYHVQVTHDPSQ